MTMLTKPKRPCRVALLLGLDYEFHRMYADTVRRIMGGDFHFSITYINVELRPEAIRKKVMELINLSDPYDVFVPVGLRCSVYLKQVCQEIGRGKIVITAVRDPLALKLVDSFESPGHDITAVVPEMPSNTAVAEKLAIIAQYIKRIIIPYSALNADDPLNQQIVDVVNFFKSYNIDVEAISVTGDEALARAAVVRELKSRVKKHDIVLLVEGGTVDICHEISYLCFEKDAAFCADTIPSMYVGAAFAFGCELHTAVTALRETLLSHWVDGIPLGDIPVKTVPNERVFFVNVAMLRMIGFPEEAIALLQKAEGIVVIKKWIDCPIKRGV